MSRQVEYFAFSHICPHTLTPTLTTESPINRAFQAESEGVRVKKEKLFFIKTKPGLGLVRALWRVQRFGTPSGYDYIRCVESIYKVD